MDDLEDLIQQDPREPFQEDNEDLEPEDWDDDFERKLDDDQLNAARAAYNKE